MSLNRLSRTRRAGTTVVAGLAVLALVGCTGNTAESDDDTATGGTTTAEAGSNDEAGDQVGAFDVLVGLVKDDQLVELPALVRDLCEDL